MKADRLPTKELDKREKDAMKRQKEKIRLAAEQKKAMKTANKTGGYVISGSGQQWEPSRSQGGFPSSELQSLLVSYYRRRA